MIVDLPLPLNLANASRLGHWRTKQRKRKQYEALLDLLFKLGKLPKPPRQPFPVSLISAHVIIGHESDIDNLFHRLKWPQDFLRRYGYIAGDSQEYLRWKGIPTQEVRRGQPYRVIFTIEDNSIAD